MVKKVNVSITLNTEMIPLIKQMANKNNRSASWVVSEALITMFRSECKKEGLDIVANFIKGK